MSETSNLIKLASVVFDRKCELIALVKKHLQHNKIELQEGILEGIVMKMNNKDFLTKMEIENRRTSSHTKMADILKDHESLINNLYETLENYKNDKTKQNIS